MDHPIPCLLGAPQEPETPTEQTGNEGPDTPCNMDTEELLAESFEQRSMAGSGPVSTEEEPHKGSECGKSFAQQDQVSAQEGTHMRENPYRCLHCQESFANACDLLRHLRIHSEEKTYTCSECGKTFKRKMEFFHHRRSHPEEKPYKCSYCSESFSWGSLLKIHNRSHVGMRLYQCPQCGKIVDQKVHFLIHLLTHRDDKPSNAPVDLQEMTSRTREGNPDSRVSVLSVEL